MPILDVQVRKATPEDVGYIDSLQKRFTNEVGFFARDWLLAYIEKWHVSLALLNGQPAGYLLGRDTCRFDPTVGRIYQTAVQMDVRHLDVGRALVAQYCAQMPETTASILLFCAQDIQANLFWEALGFQCVGYREGSRIKGRLHLAWQRSTRPEEDPLFVSLPKQTNGGLMRAQRIVLPLQPGQTWRDVRLPAVHRATPTRFPERVKSRNHDRKSRNSKKNIFVVPAGKIAVIVAGRIKYRDKGAVHP